jgi:tetratricopeptide (TPR) repeat protein
MRQVWQRFPDDADVGALFAESLMDLRPWDLWTPKGEAQPGTEEVVATLERVLAIAPRHPLALHLYIHAVEASPNPEKAEAAADRLRDLQPGLGHLVHMPSHIDVRLGHWKQAVEANAKAISADRGYRKQSPRQEFYRVYMAHNFHMLTFAAMMRGQSRLALATIQEMAAEIPPDWIKQNAAIADGFTAMPLEVLVRFGRWDEILGAPEPPAHLPLARALRFCARGIAHAAKGNTSQARFEQQSFVQACAAVPAESAFGNNKASDLLGVAERLLLAEILYREGKTDQAIAAFREGIRLEDQLRYSEPPDWIHPVRHALSAVLLQEGRAAEAEQVYRDDLAKLPDNVWSLYGLTRALREQKKDSEAAEVEVRFQKAARDADVAITTSCFCQPGPKRAN